MPLDICYKHQIFHLNVFLNDTTSYIILKMGIDYKDRIEYMNAFSNVLLNYSLLKICLHIYCNGIISFLCVLSNVSSSYYFLNRPLDFDTTFLCNLCLINVHLVKVSQIESKVPGSNPISVHLNF